MQPADGGGVVLVKVLVLVVLFQVRLADRLEPGRAFDGLPRPLHHRRSALGIGGRLLHGALRSRDADLVRPGFRRSVVEAARPALLRRVCVLLDTELLERIHASFGVRVDRESLVSSLTKKVARGDRFVRTASNTFGLLVEAR